MLKTGWINWDKYLQPIADLKGPIKILEVGAYEGSATKWMLKYLATHPESRVYAVDTWEGSPEYVGTDFHEVEEKFRQRVKETGRENQLVTLKMKSEDGLHHLLDSIGKESINFAYIDASHEARDVLSDAVLVWKLMKENGIVVFDDYRWDDLEQEFFRPRLAIDSFIRSYAPELRVIHIDRQAFVLKLDRSKWITPTINYKDWSVITKKIFSLSDAIMKLPDIHVSSDSRKSRVTRRSSKQTITDVTFTTIPSYTESDELECNIKSNILPDRQMHIMLVQIMQPDSMYDISKTKYKNKQIFINVLINKIFKKYESDKTSLLGILIDNSSLDYHANIFNEKINHHKTFMPKLKHYEYLYIKDKSDTRTYSEYNWLKHETVDSILHQTCKSLKPNYYDLISSSLMTSATFSYKEYTELKCKGRDSYSIRYNCFYLLLASYCLKKEGSLHIRFYGSQTNIICQFISYISEFFSKPPIFIVASYTQYSNTFIYIAQGFKGISASQKERLLYWYNAHTPGKFYDNLGVSCKPTIKNMCQTLSMDLEKRIKKIAIIAKLFRNILDKISPMQKNKLLEDIIGTKINNYFNEATKLLTPD